MEIDDLKNRINDIDKALMSLGNIREGAEIKRFLFTESEKLALDFAIDIINSLKQEL